MKKSLGGSVPGSGMTLALRVPMGLALAVAMALVSAMALAMASALAEAVARSAHPVSSSAGRLA